MRHRGIIPNETRVKPASRRTRRDSGVTQSGLASVVTSAPRPARRRVDPERTGQVLGGQHRRCAAAEEHGRDLGTLRAEDASGVLHLGDRVAGVRRLRTASAELGGGVGVEVAVAAPDRAERYVHVDAEGGFGQDSRHPTSVTSQPRVRVGRLGRRGSFGGNEGSPPMTFLGRFTRILTATLLAAAVTGPAMAAPAAARPDNADRQRGPSRIDLPDGFRPEGIAIGRRPLAYTGSLADGDIYRCRPAHREGASDQPGRRHAVGRDEAGRQAAAVGGRRCRR